MDVGTADWDGPAAHPCEAVVMRGYTCYFSTAKELMDMAEVPFQVCSRRML